MEWTKIPIDLLQSRKSDKEILAITKYQLLWAMLERKPDDDTALRYLTKKQLQIANDFMLSIEQCVCNDIKSVISSRKRQKNFYEKNQTVKENSNGKTNGKTNCNTNCLTTKADKIREDNIRKEEIYKEEFEEFWKEFTPVKCNGRFVDKGSKKTAYEKYVKLLEKGERHENIIRGVREYISHCQANNQLTCGATVFLNQERWKCDYGATIDGNSRTEHGESRSILETYAEIAREYK